MVMVLFRREFSFADTLYLWEVRNMMPFPAILLPFQNQMFPFCILVVVVIESCQILDSRSLFGMQMMWASEFSPDTTHTDLSNKKLQKNSGKFEQHTQKYGNTKIPAGSAPLAVFCMAAIFKMHRRRLLKDTQGLDDVVKVIIIKIATFRKCVN
jgi:hypothetical protein